MQASSFLTVASLTKAHERYIEAAGPQQSSRAASSVPVVPISSPYAIDLTNVVSFEEIQQHTSSSPRAPLSPRFSGQHPNQHYKVSTIASSRLHSGIDRMGHSPRESVMAEGSCPSQWENIRMLKGRKGELFNTKVRCHLQRMLKRNSPCSSSRDCSPPLREEGVNPLNESEIVFLIDAYLSEKIATKGFDFFQNNSPRSKEAAEEILDKLKQNDLLMAPVRRHLVQIQKILNGYIAQKRRKTAWVEELSRTLQNLRSFDRDLDSFSACLKDIEDVAIRSILLDPYEAGQKGIIFSSLFWSLPEGMEKLRGHYALLYVNYEDVQKIHQQKLFLTGGQIVPNTAVLTSRFIDFLKTISYLFINETEICLDSIKGSSKFPESFLFSFLKKYYELKRPLKPEGPLKTDREIGTEVEAIGRGEKVPSSPLFWLCVAPWSEFEEIVKLIFAPLGPQIHVRLREDLLWMTIAVEKGQCRVIKTMTYACFYENYSIADVTFNWVATIPETVSEEISSDWKNWEGCIQIPEIPQVKPHTPFKIKWLLLRQLSNFTDVSLLSSISAKPLEKSPPKIELYLNELELKLNTPTLIPQAEYVSWYTLEYHIKGVCIESIERELKKKFTVEVPLLAGEIWQQICTDGKVLEPLLSRLELFQTQLMKFMNNQPYRIPDSDRLIAVIGELLNNNELGRFVDLLETAHLHPRVKSVLMHQIFGWGVQQSPGGKSGTSSPESHVEQAWMRLMIFNSGPEFLYSPLARFTKEIISLKQQPTIHTPHQWIMSRQKTAALRKTSFNDVVRSLMVEGVPYVRKLTIYSDNKEKGVTVLRGDDLTGSKIENTRKYFSGILNAIASYRDEEGFEPDSEMISYFTNPSLIDEEENGIDKIPYFEILQLLSVNIQQNGDRFFRFLFPLNHAPLKTKVEQGLAIEIILQGQHHYVVHHHLAIGVYERGIPERVDGGALRQDRQLAYNPILWKICPYHESDTSPEQFLATLQIGERVKISQKANPAHAHQISMALSFYNSKFLENSDWETAASAPEVVSPLGIPKIFGKSSTRRFKNLYRTG